MRETRSMARARAANMIQPTDSSREGDGRHSSLIPPREEAVSHRPASVVINDRKRLANHLSLRDVRQKVTLAKVEDDITQRLVAPKIESVVAPEPVTSSCQVEEHSVGVNEFFNFDDHFSGSYQEEISSAYFHSEPLENTELPSLRVKVVTDKDGVASMQPVSANETELSLSARSPLWGNPFMGYGCSDQKIPPLPSFIAPISAPMPHDRRDSMASIFANWDEEVRPPSPKIDDSHKLHNPENQPNLANFLADYEAHLTKRGLNLGCVARYMGFAQTFVQFAHERGLDPVDYIRQRDRLTQIKSEFYALEPSKVAAASIVRMDDDFFSTLAGESGGSGLWP